MNSFLTLPKGVSNALTSTLSLFFVLICSILFVSCAPNPKLQYEILSNSSPDRVLSKKSETLRFAPTNSMILPFQEKFDFEENGQTINLGSFYSYFRIFRLEVDSGTIYRIGVRGLCDFWEGKVVIPLIYILDDKGSVVVEGPSKFTTKKVFPWVSDDVIKSFELSQARKGVVFILIAADNSHVGGEVGSGTAVGTSSLGGGVTMTSTRGFATGLYTPVGTVRLEIDKVLPTPSRDPKR